MKRLIYLIAFIILQLSVISEVNAQSGWFWQNPLPTGNNYHDISFSDSQHGFVVGDVGTVLYTSDGGQSWVAYSVGTNTLTSVHAFDSSSAIVIGAYGSIYKTTNKGIIWTKIPCSYTGPLIDISFCDPNNALIVTGSSTLLKTTNGGNEWTTFTNNVFKHFKKISMVNPNTATAITGNNAEIFRTTDGGLTWQDQTVSTLDDLEDLFFIDSNNGYAVGWNGMVLHTTDGGINWNWQTSNTGAFFILGIIFRSC